MARVAKTIITAEDKSGPGIRSAINNVLGLDDASKKVARSLTNAFTLVGLAAATKQLADFGVQAYKAFAESERAATSFATALSQRTDVSRRALESFNLSFSRAFGVDGEAIMGMQTMLLASGRTEDQITKMMNAAQALSVATGKDLKSSVEQLNKTFGGTAGELGEVIPELKALTAEQFAAGEAVNLISDRFGHLNRTLSESADVKIKNLQNAWKDLTEELGKNVSTWASPALEGIGKLVDAWATAIGNVNRYNEAVKKVADQRTVQDRIDINVKQRQDLQNKIDRSGNIADLGGDPQIEEYKAKMRELVEEYRGLIRTQDQLEKQTIAKAAAEKENTKATELQTVKIGNAFESKDAFTGALDALRLSGGWDVSGGMNEGYMEQAYAENAMNAADREQLPVSDGWQTRAAPTNEMGPVDIGMSGIGNLGDIFSSLAGGLGEVMNGLGGFFGALMQNIKSLSSVAALYNWMGTIISGVLEVIGPVVDEMLAPFVGYLKILGQMIGQLLIPVLKVLSPIMDMFAKFMLWWMNNILRPIFNSIYATFMVIVNALRNFGDFLNDVADHPLEPWKWHAGNRSTNWVDLYNNGPIQKVSMEEMVAAGNSTISGGATGGGGAGASYTGAQAITFNFYNQGNVVGAGGLEELAFVIQSILQRQARYA